MLPDTHRLKGQKTISVLFRRGKTFSDDILLLKIKRGDPEEPTQFGFAAGLKFSKKAVDRNRVKRWMREAVRPKISETKPGWKAVFAVDSKFSKDEMSFPLIQKSVENLLKKAKIL